MFRSTAPLAQVFATNVKHQRESQGLSIATLAERSGNQPEFIEAVEKAAIPELGLGEAEALADALGVDVAMLLGRDFADRRDAPEAHRYAEYIPCPPAVFTAELINRIESGEHVALTLNEMEALAGALSTTEKCLLQNPE